MHFFKKKYKLRPRTLITADGAKWIYYDEEDAVKLEKNGDSSLITYYSVAHIISDALDIPCPYIANGTTIGSDGSYVAGFTIYAADYPDQLDRDLVVIDMDLHPFLTLGTTFHELRHCWQRIHCADKYDFTFTGEKGSFRSPAEIDADGYAIAVLSLSYNKTMEDVADIFCLNVEVADEKALKKRLVAARAISSNMDSYKYRFLNFKEDNYAK